MLPWADYRNAPGRVLVSTQVQLYSIYPPGCCGSTRTRNRDHSHTTHIFQSDAGPEVQWVHSISNIDRAGIRKGSSVHRRGEHHAAVCIFLSPAGPQYLC